MADGAGEIVRQAPTGWPTGQAMSQKIEWAIEEDMRRTKITATGFFMLSPVERRKRIEKTLTDNGLAQDDLPSRGRSDPLVNMQGRPSRS